MARRLDGTVFCVVLIAAGCASAPCPKPAPAAACASAPCPEQPPAQVVSQSASAPAPVREPDWVALERKTVDPSLPLCDEQPVPLERPCRLVGIYTLSTFASKGSGVLAVWPVVVAAGGGSALVESLWFPEDFPDPETLARYEGKRVEVAGMLHHAPPHKDRTYGQNIMARTLRPVYAIRVLGDAP